MKTTNSLYKMLEKASSNQVQEYDRGCFLWIWENLLQHQSKDNLKKQLNEIEQAVKKSEHSPQTILEFAWKSEIIELMLAK